MAFLVVGIHTEPFGFNFWLDKGFGIVTRLCVPFFFVSSASFCWKNNRVIETIKRLGILYIIWSLIYLPYDIIHSKGYSVIKIIRLFFWDGNSHALWFLCGNIIGIVIVYLLLRFLDYRIILVISVLFLLVGCFKSSWAPIAFQIFKIQFSDVLGTRNGLFYGFPYVAMGMYLAKNRKWEGKPISGSIIGFAISLIALIAESMLLVVYYKTSSTILWVSVYPLTYFFFTLVCRIKIVLSEDKSRFIRKISTLIYVSHGIFLILFSGYQYMVYFLLVSIFATAFSVIIIKLSQRNSLRFLRYLY